jgi:hypothetical protein
MKPCATLTNVTICHLTTATSCLRNVGLWADSMGKVTEMKLNPNSMNKDDAFSVSSSWKPLIRCL